MRHVWHHHQSIDMEENLDVSALLLIVVGAHLRAELIDRPSAYQLRQQIESWLDEHVSDLNVPLIPVVCSDIWYINQQELQRRPTISLGGPAVNALSAYYAGKLSAAFVRDDQIMIQLDPEFVDLRASVWGMNHELTEQAIELFAGKYLESYMRAVATQVEPDTE